MEAQNASTAGRCVNLDEQTPSLCQKFFTRRRVLPSNNGMRKKSWPAMMKFGKIETAHL
jgi:hypothetical protein